MKGIKQLFSAMLKNRIKKRHFFPKVRIFQNYGQLIKWFPKCLTSPNRVVCKSSQSLQVFKHTLDSAFGKNVPYLSHYFAFNFPGHDRCLSLIGLLKQEYYRLGDISPSSED